MVKTETSNLDSFGLIVQKVDDKHHFEAKSYSDIYRMHKYWSKKPYNVISDLLRKYSQPGDIVVDPFCGSGVTIMESIKEHRKALGIDINPIAILITRETAITVESDILLLELKRIKDDLENKINELYLVKRGDFAYVMSHCLWDGERPIQIWYHKDKNILKEMPTSQDIDYANRIRYEDIKLSYPTNLLFVNSRINVNEPKPLFELFTPRNLLALSLLNKRISQIDNLEVREFFKFCLTSSMGQTTKMVFAINHRGKYNGNVRRQNSSTNLPKYDVGSWVIGYWAPKKHFEINVWDIFYRRAKKIIFTKREQVASGDVGQQVDTFEELQRGDVGTFQIINEASQTALKKIPDSSIDYVLTDPPHGDREPYLELSLMWNSWLDLTPRYQDEIVISDSKERKKGISEYLDAIEQVFQEVSRILKNGKFFTLIFNSLNDDLWSSIINISTRAGFRIENLESMNYSANSVIQDTRKMGLTRDIVMTFRKTNYNAEYREVSILSNPDEIQNAIRTVINERKTYKSDKFVFFSEVNRALMELHSFVLPSQFYLELEKVLNNTDPSEINLHVENIMQSSKNGSLDELSKLYDDNKFAKILEFSNGLRFLKLRSFSRKELMNEFVQAYHIKVNDESNAKSLFYELFNSNISESTIDQFIREQYKKLRDARRANEDNLFRELYKLKVLDWGGFRGNNVERTLVDNYIKKIWSYDELLDKIENEINPKIRGYVTSSWYNHWTSILIEDVFKDHKDILPTLGLVKKIDFFWENVPFDLKVTYFPEGYMQEIRKEKGLRPELTLLKQTARTVGIPVDNDTEEDLLDYLLTRIEECPDPRAKHFIQSLKEERNQIVSETISNPERLIKWLYENQGERRFDAANRLFLVLVDRNRLEDSWKLKRNSALWKSQITKFIDKYHNLSKGMKINFKWDGITYTTISHILFITN